MAASVSMRLSKVTSLRATGRVLKDSASLQPTHTPVRLYLHPYFIRVFAHIHIFLSLAHTCELLEM